MNPLAWVIAALFAFMLVCLLVAGYWAATAGYIVITGGAP